MSRPNFTKKQKKLGASILVIIIALVLALATGKDIRQVFSNLIETGLSEDGLGTEDLEELLSDGLTPGVAPTGTVTATTPAATGTAEAAKTPAPTETTASATTPTPEPTKSPEALVEEDGVYTTPELVAAYLHTFHKLPSNYITKSEAIKLGWNNKEGNLWEVTDQMSIGGDRFGNYEGQLPEANGRSWYECDVNYNGGYRGAERILYSNDGLIYYTDDHYETFTKLY